MAEYAGFYSGKISKEHTELFALADEMRSAAFRLLGGFNAKNVRLIDFSPHKRIFLFFLTRGVKTFSAIYTLCLNGFGQDVCPLLRSLLETVISAKYILIDKQTADEKATRFVEYKWVILKRYLADYERELFHDPDTKIISKKELILKKFNEYKSKYKIFSDRALITWSGRSIKDMAKMADKDLLAEYELAFRIYTRFSHPSIIGDNEYVNYKNSNLTLSSLPAAVGVVSNLRKGIDYIFTLFELFNEVSCLNAEEYLNGLRLRKTEVFRMQKYSRESFHEKSFSDSSRQDIEKMLIQFEIPPEE